MNAEGKRKWSIDGQLLPVNEPLGRFPALIAALLKYKKHEWIVIGFEKNRVVRQFWINKGEDRKSVTPRLGKLDITNIVRAGGYSSVIKLHNHPNSDPQNYNCLTASKQDQLSGRSLGDTLASCGTNLIEFVCERGAFVEYFRSISDSFAPVAFFAKDICAINGRDKWTNLSLHLERVWSLGSSRDTAFDSPSAQPTEESRKVPPRTLEASAGRSSPPLQDSVMLPIRGIVNRARNYRLPPSDLLEPPNPRFSIDEQALRLKARHLEECLQGFDITGEVVAIHIGPAAVIFEYKVGAGEKYNRLIELQEELARSLQAENIRIDPISGTSHIGLEVPGEQREIIRFRELIESRAYSDTPGHLPLALGKTLYGNPFVTTLDQMPHLLVAGTTGSGIGVGIDALIHSILFRSTPDEVKFIMLDSDQMRLKVYEDVPHLLTPVMIGPAKCINTLNWALREMADRHKLLAAAKANNIDQYNVFVRGLTPTSTGDFGINQPLPYLVIIIDELYDLMTAQAREVETAIAHLSAMGGAKGIHLVVATKHPRRNVITEAIKENLPARLAFRVGEKAESRLIIDQNGAEALEGKGDLLYLPPGSRRPIRLYGALLSNSDTQRVIQYLSTQ